MTMCVPDTTDWACAYTDEELAGMRDNPATAARMARAEALAWNTLAALTAWRIGVCPETVRPCSARCAPAGTWMAAPVNSGQTGALPLHTIGRSFTPHITGGQWVNSCGCSSADSCSCSAVDEVILPGPVGGIREVKIDGAVIDPTWYRVDNGNRLVSQHPGLVWPLCQDMSAPSVPVPTYEPVTLTWVKGSTMKLSRSGDVVTAELSAKANEGTFVPIPADFAPASTLSRPLPTTGDLYLDPTNYMGYGTGAGLYSTVDQQVTFQYLAAPEVIPSTDPVTLTWPSGWTVEFSRLGDIVTGVLTTTAGVNGPEYLPVPPQFQAAGPVNQIRYNSTTNPEIVVSVNEFGGPSNTGVGAFSAITPAAGTQMIFQWLGEPLPPTPGGSTFEVTYYRGAEPNEMTNYAAGLLAAEYYKACGNEKCKLSRKVTQVVRGGTSYELDWNLFEDGWTKIEAVDAVIAIYNPHHLKTPPRVLSPDGPSNVRRTTWMAR